MGSTCSTLEEGFCDSICWSLRRMLWYGGGISLTWAAIDFGSLVWHYITTATCFWILASACLLYHGVRSMYSSTISPFVRCLLLRNVLTSWISRFLLVIEVNRIAIILLCDCVWVVLVLFCRRLRRRYVSWLFPLKELFFRHSCFFFFLFLASKGGLSLHFLSK